MPTPGEGLAAAVGRAPRPGALDEELDPEPQPETTVAADSAATAIHAVTHPGKPFLPMRNGFP